MKHVDVVVVGCGLAGATLAYSLRRRGISFVVIDRMEQETSSRVAAGLVTPVTGQRLAKTWRLELLWKTAIAFYDEVARTINEPVFFPTDMIRIFQNDEERCRFEARAGSILLGVVQPLTQPLDPAYFIAPSGAFQMSPAGRLDTNVYLDGIVRLLRESDQLITHDLLPDEMIETNDGIVIDRLRLCALRVIFCEGAVARTNPLFSHIRFLPTKGEIVTLSIPELQETRIIHRAIWLLPLGNGKFRAGAPYDREHLDSIPTAAARETIERGLREFLQLPFTILDHRAAVRPIVHDQTPVLGFLAARPRVGFFNGLGSKGSLQAPYFAEQLADHLQGKGTIEKSVHLDRYGRSP